jgi:hypothetical protein
MADPKKVDLKTRLKKSQASSAQSAGTPGALPPPPVGGPTSMAPPGSIPAPPVTAPLMPGIPGLSSNLEPPDFIKQQKQAQEMARRAKAAADDPFASDSAATPGGELRIVIPEGDVHHTAVGRSRGPVIAAILIVGAAAAGGGYLLGDALAKKAEQEKTVQAVNQLRPAVTRLGGVIGEAQTNIDRAAHRANVESAREGEGGEEGAGSGPSVPYEVDEELIAWFRRQPNEPPFQPRNYAGKVRYLRADVVEKITQLQLQINELWRQLQAHQALTRVEDVRVAIQAMGRGGTTPLVAIFAPQQNTMFAQVAETAGPPGADGAIPLRTYPGAAAISTTPHRIWNGATPLDATTIGTVAVPVNLGVGVGPRVRGGATIPWTQYASRIRGLQQLVGEVRTTNEQLNTALAQRPSE